MKYVTTHDEQYEAVQELYKKFDNYLKDNEPVEQINFTKFAFIEAALMITLDHYNDIEDFVMDKKEWNAMCRTVYKAINDSQYLDFLDEQESVADA